MGTQASAPKVSIGLPTYNGARYLSAAVDSLLGQTFDDFELIISDNASTDGTRDLCERYARQDARVRYYRQPRNTGAIRNHNLTIELSRGQYFKWAADDDVYAPEFVERCVALLDENPEAVLAFARTQFIDEHGRRVREYVHPHNLSAPRRSERFLQYVFASHIMVEDYGLIRSGVLKSTPLLGNYVWSDMVLFAELTLYGPFIEAPEVLFYRRDHPQRSMRVHKDPKSLNEFNDPRKKGDRILPTWRVLGGYLACLGRAPLSAAERLSLVMGVARRATWRRRQLVAELISR